MMVRTYPVAYYYLDKEKEALNILNPEQMKEETQWFKSKDFELHYVEDEWVLLCKNEGKKQTIPIELMVSFYGIIKDRMLVDREVPKFTLPHKKWWEFWK